MQEARALGQLTWFSTISTPLSPKAAKLKVAGKLALYMNSTLTIFVFAEYLRDAIMANHFPTVEFIIQNFHSFDLVTHVYTQCKPLCSPLHSAIFPRHYLGGVYSAIAYV